MISEHIVAHRLHESSRKMRHTRDLDGGRSLSVPVCLLSQTPESSPSPPPSSPPPPAPTPASGPRKQPPPVRTQSAGGIGSGGGGGAQSRHQRVTGPSFSSGVAELYARQQQQQQQQRKSALLSAHLIDVILLHLPSLGVHCAFSTAPHHRCDGLLVLSHHSPAPSPFPLNSWLERYIYIYCLVSRHHNHRHHLSHHMYLSHLIVVCRFPLVVPSMFTCALLSRTSAINECTVACTQLYRTIHL